MLDRLLRDATLVTLALALALGWTLVLAAQGAAETISELLTHHPKSDLIDVQGTRPLTWGVDGRYLTIYSLVSGLVAFALVLAVALLVRKRAAQGLSRRGSRVT